MPSSSAPKTQPQSKSQPAAPAPSPTMSAFGVTIADRPKSSAEAGEMSKQKKQLIMVCALIGLSALILAWQYWPTGPGEDPAVAASPQIKPVIEAEQKKDIPQLQQFAASNDPIVASRAVTALGALGDSNAVQQAANDRRPEVRMAAVAGITPDASNLQTLSRFAVDNDPEVRLKSLSAIYRVPDAQAFDPIVQMLNDPSPNVRQAAIRALEAKSGFRFRDYDPSGNPARNAAVVARIRNQIQNFKPNYQMYVEEQKKSPPKSR